MGGWRWPRTAELDELHVFSESLRVGPVTNAWIPARPGLPVLVVAPACDPALLQQRARVRPARRHGHRAPACRRHRSKVKDFSGVRKLDVYENGRVNVVVE